MDATEFLISIADLRAGIGRADLCIVDCRFDLGDPAAGLSSYLDGHIPGAVYADLDKDLAAPVGPGTGRHPLPDVAALERALGRLGIDSRTEVVCYDQAAGAVAARLWWLLRWLGHGAARILDGGFAAWSAGGLAIEAGTVERPWTTFQGRPWPQLVLESAEILRTGASALNLVDARETVRFHGISEPIDTVAGHIPGALNLPFAASLNADGTWKQAADLRQIWSQTLGTARGEPWSVMCGSGVTACHLALSGLLAGLPEPRVYVGSWSEWITDPDRPVAVG